MTWMRKKEGEEGAGLVVRQVLVPDPSLDTLSTSDHLRCESGSVGSVPARCSAQPGKESPSVSSD